MILLLSLVYLVRWILLADVNMDWVARQQAGNALSVFSAAGCSSLWSGCWCVFLKKRLRGARAVNNVGVS
jgi:hypothetical protein